MTDIWWECECGQLHDGNPRRVGALTSEGVILHGPVTTSTSGGDRL